MSADMGRVAESVSSASDSVNTAVQTTISNADSYRRTLSSDTFPAINAGVGNLNVAVGNLAAAASAQRVLVDQAISLTGQLSETLTTAKRARPDRWRARRPADEHRHGEDRPRGAEDFNGDYRLLRRRHDD